MDLSPDPRTPVIVAARRSPIGTAGHALREIPVDALGAAVISALVEDLPAQVRVDEVVLGNCTGPGGNVARLAALRAGLHASVAARTVDLQCGSGLAAIVAAVDSVRSGRCEVVVAGGTESASTAPTRITADGRRYARAPFAPEGHPDPDMGEAADRLAQRAGITRERADAYAARSFARAWDAQTKGIFDAELVPVAGLTRDERIRSGVTADRLARLRPSFDPSGTVTPGNATGVNDGAAAVVVVTEELRARWDLPGLRVLDSAHRGVDPALPGLGPVPAVRALRCLSPEGGEEPAWERVDRIEINEAFAAQVLACCDALGLAEERVCTDGGAIALGHPWGASGAVLAVRLFTALVRQGRGDRGLAAIAVGGGQGVAMAVERVR